MSYYVVNHQPGRHPRYLKQPSLIGAKVNNPLVPVVFRPTLWAKTTQNALPFAEKAHAEVELRILQREAPTLLLFIESDEEVDEREAAEAEPFFDEEKLWEQHCDYLSWKRGDQEEQ